MSKAAPQPSKNTSGGKNKPLLLTIQRVPFTSAVDNKMRQMKAKTGITPNVLARFGFCLSLEEPGIPADPFAAEEHGRDINRNTLLGEHDVIYVALLRAWLEHRRINEVNEDEFNRFFVSHMNRGFELLSSRMRGLSDLVNLVDRENRKIRE